MKQADELSQHRGFGPVRQPVGRSPAPDCSALRCPADKALRSAWLRLNKWCDYHKIETVLAEGGFVWECQIGSVVSRAPDLLRAIAETHRKIKSISRNQNKPNTPADLRAGQATKE